MNVINEQEKVILENIRMKKPSQGQPINQSRMAVNRASVNQPFYAPPEAYNHQYNSQHFYYPPHQPENGDEY